MEKFWMRRLNVGPLHLSIVRNDVLRTFQRSVYGGFVSLHRGSMQSTLRVGWLFINVDWLS